MHLNQMYSKLNPNQRREVQIEVNRQRMIEELEAELKNALKKVSVWKSTLCFCSCGFFGTCIEVV